MLSCGFRLFQRGNRAFARNDIWENSLENIMGKTEKESRKGGKKKWRESRRHFQRG